MYMTSYSGTNSRTFNTHDTIDNAKKEAEEHAVQNGRLKGKYTVCEGGLICGDLFTTTLGGEIVRGIKQGKNIEWES